MQNSMASNHQLIDTTLYWRRRFAGHGEDVERLMARLGAHERNVYREAGREKASVGDDHQRSRD